MNQGHHEGRLKCGGFTIIETMIVLAVTGALFVAIAATLSGRQSEAEFISSVQNAKFQIQDIINQVSDGLYPSQNNFTCSAVGSGIQFTPGSTTQGTNQDCVFLGRVIQLGINTKVGPRTGYNIYTVAGLRTASQTASGSSPFDGYYPTVTAANSSNVFALSSGSFEYGLSARWIQVGSESIGAIAFLMEPGTLSSSSANGYETGSQLVDLIPIDGSSLQQSSSKFIQLVDQDLQSSTLNNHINPPNGISICLEGGNGSQSGLITIGASGQTLLVNLSIKSGGTC